MNHLARILVALSSFFVASLLMAGEPPPATGAVEGTVTETMISGGYTYLMVNDGTRSVWVATRDCTVSVGDKVQVPSTWEMRDFRSATLERTFDVIFFAPRVLVGGESVGDPAPNALPKGHPALPGTPEKGAIAAPSDAHHGSASPAPIVLPKQVAPAPGGVTIAECFAKRDELAGKPIKVRGVAVKFTSDILGANWIHLRDGTGSAGTDDLTVTTAQTVKVGDVVLIEGVIEYGKDIGSGYSFPAIVERALVTVETDSGKAPAGNPEK